MENRQLRFLYVDNDNDMREMLPHLIESSFPGYKVEVKTGKDGKELKALAKSEKFNGYVFDNNMPFQNGSDALVNLRLERDITPALIISGRQSEELKSNLEILASTRVAFLQKPFTSQEFYKAMQAHWPEYSTPQ